MSRFYKVSNNSFIEDFIYSPNYKLKAKLVEQQIQKQKLKSHLVKGFDFINTFKGWQDDADFIVNEINNKKIRPLAKKLMEDPNNEENINQLYKTIYEVRKELTSGDLGDMIYKYNVYTKSKKDYENRLKDIKDFYKKTEHLSKIQDWENYTLSQVGNEYNKEADINSIVPYYDVNKLLSEIKTDNLKYSIEQIRRKNPFIIKNGKTIFKKDWENLGLKYTNRDLNRVKDEKGNVYNVGSTPMDFVRLRNIPFEYERYIDTKKGFYKNLISGLAKQKLMSSEGYLKSLAQDYKFQGGKEGTNKTFEEYLNKRINIDVNAFSEQFPEVTTIKEKPEYKSDIYRRSLALQNKKSEEKLSTVFSITNKENIYDPKYVQNVGDDFFELWSKKVSGKDLTESERARFYKYDKTFASFFDNLTDIEKAQVNAYYNLTPNKPSLIKRESIIRNKFDDNINIYDKSKEEYDLVKESMKSSINKIKKKFNTFLKNIYKGKQKKYTGITYPTKIINNKGKEQYTNDDLIIKTKMDSEFFNAVNNGNYTIYLGEYSHNKPVYGGLSKPIEGAKNVSGNKTGNPLLDLVEAVNAKSIEDLFIPNSYQRIVEGNKVYIKGKLKNEVIKKADSSIIFNGLRDSDNNSVSNYVTIDLGNINNDIVTKSLVGNPNIEEEFWDNVAVPSLNYANNVYNETISILLTPENNNPLIKEIPTPKFLINNKKYYFKYHNTKEKYFELFDEKENKVYINNKSQIPENLLKKTILAIVNNPDLLSINK